jgi:hypothetical protein
MRKILRTIAALATNKMTYFVILFVYFGFMAVPQWFRSWSPQQLIWLIALPFVLFTLLVLGGWGRLAIHESKTKNVEPNPRWISATQVSAFGLCTFVLSIVLAYGTHHLYNHQKFVAEVWKNPESARYVPYDLTLRQRMLDDVLENILPGSTQSEIIALLGEPTDTGYFFQSGRDLIYVLGAERGLGVDSEWLLIWFDNSGNFERYEIVVD